MISSLLLENLHSCKTTLKITIVTIIEGVCFNTLFCARSYAREFTGIVPTIQVGITITTSLTDEDTSHMYNVTHRIQIIISKFQNLLHRSGEGHFWQEKQS